MEDQDAADAELDAQAQVMAEKALAMLPESVRATKIGKVKEGILKRLKDQAAKAAGGQPVQVSPAGPAPPPPSGPPPPPTPVEEEKKYEKMEGIEAVGDEDWFADLRVRRELRDGVIAAHAEQKILIGPPSEEVKRIWPGGGRILGAGAVLRLGGAHVGGYGENDIAYAYRQLSRALHPDKNPDNPDAPDAFKRLSEAADELRAGLNDGRNVLRLLMAAMGGTVTNEMLERPQEALMAEACRLLCAVVAVAGEGEVSPTALTRGVASLTKSSTYYNVQPQALLSQFFDMNSLLDYYAGVPIRTAYDCSKKRFRAQFLCALNRVTIVEAKRQSDCIRGNWQEVLMQFPELSLWRELLDKLKSKVWTPDPVIEIADEEGKKASKWDEAAPVVKGPCTWAQKWQKIMKAVLPRGIDGTVPLTHPEVRKMLAALWKEVVEFAQQEGLDRHLGLFSADPVRQPDGNFAPPIDQWCFVPAADLLLIVGDGIVGQTAEGVFGDSRPGHEPVSFEDALKGDEVKKKPKRSKSRSNDRDRDRDDRRSSRDESERDKEKREQQEKMKSFDWESEWRNRAKRGKRNRSWDKEIPIRERDRNRSRSRDRRRRRRSESRRRSRSGGRRGRRGRDDD